MKNKRLVLFFCIFLLLINNKAHAVDVMTPHVSMYDESRQDCSCDPVDFNITDAQQCIIAGSMVFWGLLFVTGIALLTILIPSSEASGGSTSTAV